MMSIWQANREPDVADLVAPLIKSSKDDVISSVVNDLLRRDIFVQERGVVKRVDPRKILSSRRDLSSMKISSALSGCTCIDMQELAGRAIEAFDSRSVDIAICSSGKLCGVIQGVNLLGSLRPEVVEKAIEQLRQYPGASPHARLGTVIEILQEQPSVIIRNKHAEGILTPTSVLFRYLLSRHERDHGQKPRRNTRKFTAERVDILATNAENVMWLLPVITNDATAVISALSDHPEGILVRTSRGIRQVSAGALIHQIALSYPHEKKPAVRVQLSGIKTLPVSDFTIRQMRRVATLEAKKLARGVHNDVSLHVHFVVHSQEGGAHKYSVRAHLSYPGGLIAATAHGWDVQKTLHESLEGLSSQLGHRFRRMNRSLASIRRD